MSWRLFKIELAVLSPLHVGSIPVGNILRTRRYVPGKPLWGAVTALAVERMGGPFEPQWYKAVGQEVRESLRFGYFFPHAGAECSGATVEDGDRFEYRYLETYSSTAINSGAGAAEVNSLHEIEAIRSRTRPLRGEEAQQVCLTGHLAARETEQIRIDGNGILYRGLSLAGLLGELQLGGERRYGFGKLRLAGMAPTDTLFSAEFAGGETPTVMLPQQAPASAHVSMKGCEDAREGRAEPVVGREWREDQGRGAGQHLPQPRFCWAPGAQFAKERPFVIGDYGIWEAA